MALVILNTAGTPLGEFDALDAIATTVKGGEVLMFTTVSTTGSDQRAADQADGYDYPGTSRTVLTTTLTSNRGPLMLCDDGTANYGTLFGTVVGGAVGQQVTGGAVLGPHTAAGSGKLTAWITPGFYGVTLDSSDPATDTGLQPSNGSLTAGKPLYATAAGLLTPDATKSFQANRVVGYFSDFRTKGSLVTTPNRLVQALNSPAGAIASTTSSLYMACFDWSPSNGT